MFIEKTRCTYYYRYVFQKQEQKQYIIYYKNDFKKNLLKNIKQ